MQLPSSLQWKVIFSEKIPVGVDEKPLFIVANTLTTSWSMVSLRVTVSCVILLFVWLLWTAARHCIANNTSNQSSGWRKLSHIAETSFRNSTASVCAASSCYSVETTAAALVHRRRHQAARQLRIYWWRRVLPDKVVIMFGIVVVKNLWSDT